MVHSRHHLRSAKTEFSVRAAVSSVRASAERAAPIRHRRRCSLEPRVPSRAAAAAGRGGEGETGSGGPANGRPAAAAAAAAGRHWLPSRANRAPAERSERSPVPADCVGRPRQEGVRERALSGAPRRVRLRAGPGRCRDWVCL